MYRSGTETRRSIERARKMGNVNAACEKRTFVNLKFSWVLLMKEDKRLIKYLRHFWLDNARGKSLARGSRASASCRTKHAVLHSRSSCMELPRSFTTGTHSAAPPKLRGTSLQLAGFWAQRMLLRRVRPGCVGGRICPTQRS